MRFVRILGVLWLAGIALQAHAQGLTVGGGTLPRVTKTVSFSGDFPDLLVPMSQVGLGSNSQVAVLPAFDTALGPLSDVSLTFQLTPIDRGLTNSRNPFSQIASLGVAVRFVDTEAVFSVGSQTGELDPSSTVTRRFSRSTAPDTVAVTDTSFSALATGQGPILRVFGSADILDRRLVSSNDAAVGWEGAKWSLTYSYLTLADPVDGGVGNVIPEPSAWTFAVLGSLALVVSARRVRAQRVPPATHS
jgi:hypothetical protein